MIRPAYVFSSPAWGNHDVVRDQEDDERDGQRGGEDREQDVGALEGGVRMPSVEGLRIIGVFRVVRDTTVMFVEVVMPPVLSRFRVRLQSPDCVRIGLSQ